MLNWKSIPPLGGVLESLDPNRSIAIHLGREIICGTAGTYVEENRLRPILMKKAIKRHDEDTLFIHTTHVWVV